MRDIRIQKFERELVTDEHLAEAARLFSNNYGVWGPKACDPAGTRRRRQLRSSRLSSLTGKPATIGKRIRLSPRKLRDELLVDGAAYTRLFCDGKLAGHAFSCCWRTCDGRRVRWITQLVVAKEYRDQGLAKMMLLSLKEDGVDVYGIMSSHPFACAAAARAFAGEHWTSAIVYLHILIYWYNRFDG